MKKTALITGARGQDAFYLGKLLLSKNYIVVLLTRNNFLISMELQTGKILYSYDLNEKIAAYLNSKKKKAEFKSFYVAGNKF